MFYGNEYRILSGIIKNVQNSMLKVQFDTEYAKNKVFNIPKNIIRSEIIYQTDIPQSFKVPTWYLKKNRIVPLFEKH